MPTTPTAPPALPRRGESRLTRAYLDRVRSRPEGWRARDARLAPLAIAPPARVLGRPVLLDAEEFRTVEAAVAGFFDLLVALPDRLYDGDLARYAAAVGMSPTQTALVLRSAAQGPGPGPQPGAAPRTGPDAGTGPGVGQGADGARGPVRLGRVDLYRDATGFKLLEFNLGSALGGTEIAEVNRAVLADPAAAAFVAAEGLSFTDPLPAVVAAMVAGLPVPPGRRPVVALVDAPASYVTLAPYLAHLAALLGRHGVDAVAGHLGQLETGAGGVRLHGRRVDVVQRFFLPPDFAAGPDAERVAAVLDAVDRGDVRLFTPLESELHGTKAALALLSDPRHRDRLTAGEAALVDRFLPWTRFVRDGHTDVDGQRVDLLPYVLAHRDDLVLKPSLLYGGLDVVPGWTTAPADWDRHVRAAAADGSVVVQRRVRPVAERFPVPGEPGRTESLVVNYGVFLTPAGHGGATARGAADQSVGVLSMSAGARPGCVFVARTP